MAEWKELADFYDEIYDSNQGIREAYSQILPIVKKIELMEPERIDNFERVSLNDFKGDNKLYHIPRMLTKEEHKTITTGVLQRGRALQAFLLDYFRNGDNASFITSGTLPLNLFKQILSRSHELFEKKGHLNSKIFDNWGFWFGPDIVRAGDGNFYICEDNIGFVGGMGDLLCAKQSILNYFGEYHPVLENSHDPEVFYDNLANKYKSMVASDEKVVLLHYPGRLSADNEEKRVIRIFRKRGIETVVLPGANKRKKFNKQQTRTELQVFKNTINLIINKKRKGRVVQKVGLIIIDAEPFDIDPRHSSVKRKLILDEATSSLENYDESITTLSEKSKNNATKKGLPKKIQKIQAKRDELANLLSSEPKDYQQIFEFMKFNKRRDLKDALTQGYSGLFDCYYAGNVKLINGPGYDFLGDKLFCMFVSQFIKFYLKEEPIISEIPTLSFSDDKGNLNNALLNSVFTDPFIQNHVVLKRVDGRGGAAVWVGPKIERNEFLAVQNLIINEPAAFIVQKYMSLSQLDGHLVDIRNLALVNNDGVIVSDTLWGRGVPASGNGKVNISDKGFEFCVCSC